MAVDQKAKDFRDDLKQVFSTEAGERVLEGLKAQYVDLTAIGETPEVTYYKLGQKEFVQSLINFMNSTDEEMSVETVTDDFGG